MKILFFSPAYFLDNDYNILTVVYTHLAPTLHCYKEAVYNMNIISRCTVELLQKIMEKHSHIKYKHVIGFSLGAQIAGTMAKMMKNLQLPGFDRITGE